MTKRITLCPGHSRAKPGANHGDLKEEDLVYGIGRDAQACLSQWSYLAVRLARDADGPHKPYGERALEAMALKTDLVICLHADVMPGDELTHGLTVFYMPDDALGAVVADVMSRSAPAPLLRKPELRLQMASPGDWTRRAWLVMDAYRAVGLPVVLVELGFLTNAKDRMALTALETRPAIAAMLACGIARMIEFTHSGVGNV